jgi:hypothetical protein
MKTLLQPHLAMQAQQIEIGPLCLALIVLAMQVLLTPEANAMSTPPTSDAQPSEPLPWSELGARAVADYKGDGLSVSVGAEGTVRLRCAFQRLEGETTSEGLWLTSTIANTVTERFQVVASSVGRRAKLIETLPHTGTVSSDKQTVRFIRPGLVEEYSVTIDGVRQDFVVTQRPMGTGALEVQLTVRGAAVEQAADGAQLVLEKSGRRIAYSRLRVSDARGRELPARMELVGRSSSLSIAASREAHIRMTGEGVAERPRAPQLAVVVDDTNAVYPVRVDPTFSDANWTSVGGLPGANHWVRAAVTDGTGNVYIGGDFTIVGETTANYIAKWDGNSWSALGSGLDDPVYSLAVRGSNLYVGGFFTMAGGNPANCTARWDGSSWSSLGSGMNSVVYALAVSSNNLYAGGNFTNAGGSGASRIAKWDGSSWSPLGSGMGGPVFTLAVLGGDLYAGGVFTLAGGTPVGRIARWDGSNWSNLGSGMTNSVYALAVSGTNLYAGGAFQNAGGRVANYIARWDGSSWSSLGSGMGAFVYALAMSGDDLYAAGTGGIAKWDGSSWSGLGSGANYYVLALAIFGSDLYAGGLFRMEDGAIANHVARAYLERPTLSVIRSGGDVTLAWPTFYEGFMLQQNSDASNTSAWSNANYPLTTNGSIKSSTTPATPTNRFFRLIETEP